MKIIIIDYLSKELVSIYFDTIQNARHLAQQKPNLRDELSKRWARVFRNGSPARGATPIWTEDIITTTLSNEGLASWKTQ